MRKDDLYIIQSDITGAIKIGRSKNPSRRIHQLQTGSPYKLKLLTIAEGKGFMEKEIHKKLIRYKAECKGEWFDFMCTGSFPIWLYEMIDWDDANTWWDQKI